MLNTPKILFILLISLFFTACNKDNKEEEGKKSDLTYRMNQFIYEQMSVFYLWNDHMPNLLPTSEKDPKTYFNSLLYSKDQWSLIEDDAEEFLEELNGTQETFGFEWSGGKFKNSTEYFAVVKYVYPNSPAAGKLKRGDIIMELDRQALTTTNLPQLNQKGTIELTLGEKKDNTIYTTDKRINLTSQKIDTDPVLISKVFDKGTHKIGYLMYTSFIDKYNSSLEQAFNNFKSQGITDLILDLRYNHGGNDNASTFLCSAIAPKAQAVNGKLLSKEIWNDICQPIFENDSKYKDRIYRYFKTLNCNLDLPSQKVYILTSGETASASEYTAICLKAFMEVVLVGTQTYGKYTTMIGLSPTYEENGKLVPDKELSNWIMFPVCSRYTNVNGYPDFLEGLLPDHTEEDDIMNPTPLGDEAEPLLAKALSVITGQAQPTSKTKISVSNIEMLPIELRDIKSNRIIFMNHSQK